MKNVHIDPHAIVESDQVGDGTNIWAFSHVQEGAIVGSNCNVGEQCYIESGAFVGDNVTLKNSNQIWEGITIRSDVFVGHNVSFINDNYPRSPRGKAAQSRYDSKGEWLVRTEVQTGSTIGAGAVILGGITIGQFAMVAAGAVVTADVQPYALVRGNPAEKEGNVCQCGFIVQEIGEEMQCPRCESRYAVKGESIELIPDTPE